MLQRVLNKLWSSQLVGNIAKKPGDQKHQNSTSEKKDLLQGLLRRKGLNPDIFKQKSIQLHDDISKHIAWAFKHIYSVPYPNSVNDEDGVARCFHGIQHVTRALIYLPVFANLYRKYGDEAALALTPQDIKLLQIAVLFHDAAREGEEEDLWDHESGLLLFYYLTQTLDVSEQKAKMLAEAVANKDVSKAGAKTTYKVLEKNQEGEWVWRDTPDIPEKNIYQKLIQNSDCLDIIRARPHFDANYLDFYQDYAKNNQDAFEDMAMLITEARSIITAQGDAYGEMNVAVKRLYEHGQAYSANMVCMLKDAKESKTADSLIKNEYNKNYKIIPAFYHHQLAGRTLFQPFKSEGMQARLESGEILVRAINEPMRLGRKVYNLSDKEGHDIKRQETHVETEIRKMLRRPGKKTYSGSIVKNGNPDRSATLLVPSVPPFANVGYWFYPNLNDISMASTKDAVTGFGNKTDFKTIEKKITHEEKSKQLSGLVRTAKMGGTSRTIGVTTISHNEVVSDIKHAEGVFYCNDKTLCTSEYSSPESHMLQAVYIQQEFAKNGIKLPIFEYSVAHGQMKKKSFDEDDIVSMWVNMCSHYVKGKLLKYEYIDVLSMSLDNIKTFSMHGESPEAKAGQYYSVDYNYSRPLATKLKLALEKMNNEVISDARKKLIRDITEEKVCVFNHAIFSMLQTDNQLKEDGRIKSVIQKQYAMKPWLYNDTISSSLLKSALEYATKIHDLKEMEAIKKHACEVVMSRLNESSKAIDPIYHVSITFGLVSLTDLIQYAKDCDVYDRLQDPMKKYVAKLAAWLTPNYRQTCATNELMLLIAEIKKFQLMTEESRGVLLKFISSLVHDLNQVNDLINYLIIAAEVKVSFEEQKTHVINFLKSDDYSSGKLVLKLFDQLESQGFFQDEKMIDTAMRNLKCSSDLSFPAMRLLSFEYYCENLRNLHGRLSKSNLREEFLEKLIKEKIHLIYEEHADFLKNGKNRRYYNSPHVLANFLKMAKEEGVAIKECQDTILIWLNQINAFSIDDLPTLISVFKKNSQIINPLVYEQILRKFPRDQNKQDDYQHHVGVFDAVVLNNKLTPELLAVRSKINSEIVSGAERSHFARPS